MRNKPNATRKSSRKSVTRLTENVNTPVDWNKVPIKGEPGYAEFMRARGVPVR